ncbi:MAG: DUF4331 family protein [Gemmatimonadales bacterium]
MITLSRPTRIGLAVALGIGALAGARQYAVASDHQDTADVELNPKQDMTDFYAFPTTAGRIALVLNSQPFIAPSAVATASFDKNLLYQIKVDNSGDAVEDKVFQITFTGTGATQQVEVRGPFVPSVKGAMQNVLSTDEPVVKGNINTVLGTSSGVQVYAGVRDDPFFIDLEQFFRILPDRRPGTGPLSTPSTATASAFRPVGQAVDAVLGANLASIVIELPTSMLTSGGNAKIGLWGTISR